MYKLIFLIILLFFIVFTNNVSAGDGYPFDSASHPSSENDGWGFYKRQCTSYVAYKANQTGVSFSNGMTGPNNTSGTFGNALNWDNNASSIGYLVNNNRAIGSIAQWEGDTGGAGSAGHVAWVKGLEANNTVLIGEYNWNNGDGLYNERTTHSGNTPSHYIHLSSNISCGGSNVSIINQNITTALNCPAISSVTLSPDTAIQPGANVVRFFIQ